VTPGSEAVLAAAVAGADPAALLPARRAGEEARLVPPLVLRAALELPCGGAARIRAAVSLVADQGGSMLAGPIVLERGSARRAVPGDGAAAALVRLLRERPAPDATFELLTLAPLGPLGALGEDGEDGEESGIAADQTHDSVVLSDGPGGAGGVVVKWAVHVEAAAGQPPAVSAVRHLHAAGFTEMPEPYGFLVGHVGGAAVLLASVARYLPGAQDGWDWYVEDVLSMVAGRMSLSSAVEPAAVLGGLVARMHLAFARPDPAGPAGAGTVVSAGSEDLSAWARRATATLDEALALTPGAAGQRLRKRAEQARSILSSIEALDPAATALTRIHGDLHVGQVLRWHGGYAVSDFDGNPVLPAAERGQPQPPARDVAGMLRALDHVGRIVVRRTEPRTEPRAGAGLDDWFEASREAFLAAYLGELARGDGSALFDARLVRAFEVEQECRELVYAARHLPRWIYVPDSALGPLLDRDDIGAGGQLRRARPRADRGPGAQSVGAP
jgi:maltokinase